MFNLSSRFFLWSLSFNRFLLIMQIRFILIKKKESNENLLRMVFVSIFCVTPLSSTLHPAISKTETWLILRWNQFDIYSDFFYKILKSNLITGCLKYFPCLPETNVEYLRLQKKQPKAPTTQILSKSRSEIECFGFPELF
jgi:hypothetical protein